MGGGTKSSEEALGSIGFLAGMEPPWSACLYVTPPFHTNSHVGMLVARSLLFGAQMGGPQPSCPDNWCDKHGTAQGKERA